MATMKKKCYRCESFAELLQDILADLKKLDNQYWSVIKIKAVLKSSGWPQTNWLQRLCKRSRIKAYGKRKAV